MTEFLDFLGDKAIRALAFFVRKLPAGTALKIGAIAGDLFFLLASRRRVAYSDLKAALGSSLSEQERRKVIRNHYRHLGQSFMEVLRFPVMNLETMDRFIQLKERDQFIGTIEKNRGVIFLTGHYGNWELAQIYSGLMGRPVHVLGRPQKYRRLNEYLNRLREVHGSVAISRGMGVRDLIKALRRKELIGMLGDQDAGKQEGLIVPFFGRKTTVPTGAFEFAQRYEAPIVPAFMARIKGPEHVIYIEEVIEIPQTGSPENDRLEIEKGIRKYLNLLETMIRRHPDQWLWSTKRWKYNWTKRLLILSDGKPGHVKQSEALAALFQRLKDQYGRPGMEYPVSKVEVRYRSESHRRWLFILAPFLLPWIQGRLRWLRPFLTPESFQALLEAQGEFVISAGSSMTPLLLLMSRDLRAKRVILMKPGFPYSFFHYDLAVIPAHDTGRVPKETFRTLFVPSQMAEQMKTSGPSFARRLKHPAKVKWGVFLGGATRRFDMDLVFVEKLFLKLSQRAKQEGDYIVTTSRRTPAGIVRFLKERVMQDPYCQKIVFAGEDNPPDTVPGMMAIAPVLIVTPDSVSMISEAVSSGKQVIVLDGGIEKLPRKHRDFLTLMAAEGMISLMPVERLAETEEAFKITASQKSREQDERLTERIRAIL